MTARECNARSAECTHLEPLRAQFGIFRDQINIDRRAAPAKSQGINMACARRSESSTGVRAIAMPTDRRRSKQRTRRLKVRSDMPFYSLHHVIQAAMG